MKKKDKERGGAISCPLFSSNHFFCPSLSIYGKSSWSIFTTRTFLKIFFLLTSVWSWGKRSLSLFLLYNTPRQVLSAFLFRTHGIVVRLSNWIEYGTHEGTHKPIEKKSTLRVVEAFWDGWRASLSLYIWFFPLCLHLVNDRFSFSVFYIYLDAS